MQAAVKVAAVGVEVARSVVAERVEPVVANGEVVESVGVVLVERAG